MKKGKLSHRITWRVIGIMSFFNVLIFGAILVFVFRVSLVNSDMRGQYVVDGIEGKIESTLWAVHIAAANSRDEIERNLESPEQVFDALEREITVNQFMGCFAAFEPDYFEGQGRWFEAYLYHTDPSTSSGTDSTRIERQQIGYEPFPFLIALMISVSSSFATPIGSPTHMLVYAPGGYRFSDFIRIGLPMNLIILAANIFIVNIVYPLTPLP